MSHRPNLRKGSGAGGWLTPGYEDKLPRVWGQRRKSFKDKSGPGNPEPASLCWSRELQNFCEIQGHRKNLRDVREP